jgi:hypothetical protein
MTHEYPGGLIESLDQIRANRETHVPLAKRVPVYLKAAKEAVQSPGVRSTAVDFVNLAVKARVTTVFQAGVEKLEQLEPAITNAIETTGNKIVAKIKRIGRL